jgi:Flp pilus assembly protein TadD
VSFPQPSAASAAVAAPPPQTSDSAAAGLEQRAEPAALPEAKTEAAPPEIPAPSALDPHTPPSLPGTRTAFDVESLFDDKLEPERAPIGAPAEPTSSNEKLPAAPSSYRPPRTAVARTWPLLAAAGLLSLTVVGFSARACNSQGSQVASSKPAPRVEPAPPPPPAAAAAPAASAEPAAPAATAAAQPSEPAASEPAEKATGETEAVAAADTTASPAQSRTLTAAQARPVPLSSRGGVIAYQAAAEPDVDYKARGRTLFSSGKYREAADAYQRASQRTPSDAGAYAGLGASWLAAGQADRAISAYQRAVQLKPDVSGFQAALGRAYLQKGDRGRAAAAYRKALDLDPQNPAAKTGLASLQ